MRTVREVSRLTGVSVRTLHHYDAIGLLPPTCVTEAGYRLYDDEALRRLRRILLFRELEFPLREIKAILERPDFDPAAALDDQIRLLELRRARLERLIRLAREIREKGENIMAFDAFDDRELRQYEQEARARWGATPAWAEYELRTAPRDPGDVLTPIFAALGALRGQSPDAPEVQRQVALLRTAITEHYYTCTPEILRGLGEMYVSDERFRANIDAAGGEGTAELARQAIAVYCAQQ